MRRLTVLLFRDEGPGEDGNIGCVGNYGSEWRHAPEMFERFNVVDEATHERLVDMVAELDELVCYYHGCFPLDRVTEKQRRLNDTMVKSRNLLASLEAEKGGE